MIMPSQLFSLSATFLTLPLIVVGNSSTNSICLTRDLIWNDAASAFGKGASSRAFRTVVFLAGFLCVGGFPALSSRTCLLAFLYEEKPDRARFLRELFIQKKKDGKKRFFSLSAAG